MTLPQVQGNNHLKYCSNLQRGSGVMARTNSDGRRTPDGQRHNIIRTVWRRAYKNYYYECLLNELGFTSTSGNTFYTRINLTKDEILQNHLSVLRGPSGVWVRREIAQVSNMTFRAFYLTSQCRIYTGKNWRCRCLEEKTHVSFFFFPPFNKGISFLLAPFTGYVKMYFIIGKLMKNVKRWHKSK
jgi:hypothetical protein